MSVDPVYATAMASSHKFWGFTAVIYERGDPLSFFAGVVSLVPVIFIVMIFTIGVIHPSKKMAFLCTGMALNFAISVILKKICKQARPEHPWALAGRSDFGMPSNHSQFMSYLFMACVFSAIDFATEKRWLKVATDKKDDDAKALTRNDSNGGSANVLSSPDEGNSNTAATNAAARLNQLSLRDRRMALKKHKAESYRDMMLARHALRLTVLLVLTLLVGWSRIYGVFHTIEQVTAGFACGVVCAILFYRVPAITHFVVVLNRVTFAPLLRLGYNVLVHQ